MLENIKESGKAAKCTRAFSAVIVVAMVLGGFLGIVSTNIGSGNAQAAWPNCSYSLNSNLPDVRWQFSFVHLTDLHIGEGFGDFGAHGYWDSSPPPAGQDGYAAERTRNAVQWINTYKNSYKIKFVMVTGDLTDSGEYSEFMKAKEILDGLTVPYIPIIGNHDTWGATDDTESYYPRGDRYFRAVFGPQFNKLKTQLPRWDDGTRNTPLRDGDVDSLAGDGGGASWDVYWQNFAFDYAGYHFMCVDLNTRDHAMDDPRTPHREKGAMPYAELLSPTWSWFKNHYNNYKYKAADNILIFAHQPLEPEGFSFMPWDYAIVADFLNDNDYKYSTGLWCAGHTHNTYTFSVKDGLSTVCPCVVTAAVKDNENNLRVMYIYGKTSIPEPYGVILYQHINYKGRGEFFPSNYPSSAYGDPDLRNNIVGNDVASSHRVYKPYTYVYLYRDINYGGGYKLFTSDISDYRSYGINDWASSIKVW
ncbi:MAG: metallophosphoesterase [Candidatus Thermoplasmatota archaeon]